MTSTKKPALVLDFDRVLFDTEAFRVALRDAVRPLGVSVKRWQTAYANRGEDGIFRPGETAKQLAAATEQPEAGLRQALQAEIDDAAWYLYADARPFLDRMAGACNLYLLTFGEGATQQGKIKACGIESMFTAIYCVEQPKASTKVLPFPAVEPAIFVNDNVTEMLELAQIYRWSHHLHLNRGKPVEKPMPFPSYRDLREAGDAIEGLLAAPASQAA